MAWLSINIWTSSTLHIRFPDRCLASWTGTGLSGAVSSCPFISYLPITACISNGVFGGGGSIILVFAYFHLEFPLYPMEAIAWSGHIHNSHLFTVMIITTCIGRAFSWMVFKSFSPSRGSWQFVRQASSGSGHIINKAGDTTGQDRAGQHNQHTPLSSP